MSFLSARDTHAWAATAIDSGGTDWPKASVNLLLLTTAHRCPPIVGPLMDSTCRFRLLRRVSVDAPAPRLQHCRQAPGRLAADVSISAAGTARVLASPIAAMAMLVSVEHASGATLRCAAEPALAARHRRRARHACAKIRPRFSAPIRRPAAAWPGAALLFFHYAPTVKPGSPRRRHMRGRRTIFLSARHHTQSRFVVDSLPGGRDDVMTKAGDMPCGMPLLLRCSLLCVLRRHFAAARHFSCTFCQTE